jgi:hypothetical protein
MVDTVPTALLVLLVVGGVVGVVLLGVLAARRFVPATREGFDAEVSSQMLGVVASLFGLLLAFVVVIEFQAFSAAGDNVQTEADGLAAITRDSASFDGQGGEEVRSAIGVYLRAVVGEEWEAMRDGRESAAAWEGMDGLFGAVQAATPSGVAQEAFYDDSVRRLNVVLDARRDRLIASADSDLPLVIAALILVGSIVLLGYVTLVGSRSAAFHLIGAGSIAVVVGFSLVVLMLLQFPFSGGLAVEPTPYGQGALAPLLKGSK